MLGLAGKIFDKLLFFLHTLLLCLKWQQPCASALKICLKNRCLGYGTAVWVEKMLDDKALFDANDASIRAGPWITGAAGPQPRGRMAGWSPPKSLTPPTLRGEPAAGAPACTAALTLGHLLREITGLAHFRLRPLSSLSNAERRAS